MKHIEIVRSLAKKYGMDARVVDLVIKSPFMFMAKKMASLDDVEALRLPYFGIFAYKHRSTQLRKQKMLLSSASRKLKDLINKSNGNTSEDYIKGVKDSFDIIAGLIKDRDSFPYKYGFDKIDDAV